MFAVNGPPARTQVTISEHRNATCWNGGSDRATKPHPDSRRGGNVFGLAASKSDDHSQRKTADHRTAKGLGIGDRVNEWTTARVLAIEMKRNAIGADDLSSNS